MDKRHDLSVSSKRPRESSVVSDVVKKAPRLAGQEDEKTLTKIKVSDLKNQPLCAIPTRCVMGSLSVHDFDDPDTTFIQLFRCLKMEQVNENIMAIQLSILFNLTTTLAHNDTLKTKDKQTFVDRLLGQYCKAYYYWIYTRFINTVYNKHTTFDGAKFAQTYLQENLLTNTYMEKFKKSSKLGLVLQIVTLIGRFVHTDSSYSKKNYSVMDFINNVLHYNEDDFTRSPHPSGTASDSLPMIYAGLGLPNGLQLFLSNHSHRDNIDDSHGEWSIRRLDQSFGHPIRY